MADEPEDDATDDGHTGFSERTAWARNLAAPLRDFLRTETGGAIALFAATLVALLWANSPWPNSYESVWTTTLSIRLGDAGISLDLRHWVNEGLMTFFFLVVGLEARRELDMGQLTSAVRAARARGHGGQAPGRDHGSRLTSGLERHGSVSTGRLWR